MNRHRYRSDMEASWELRPATDETPGSRAHCNRFLSGNEKQTSPADKKSSNLPKNKENGS